MKSRSRIKDNYRAWEINDDDFVKLENDEIRLLFLCRYAILAPSGHNTQPWRIEQKDDGGLDLYINRAHFLEGGSEALLQVEPHVSMGTFLETLMAAGLGHGYQVAVQYVLEGDKIANIAMGKRVKPVPELLAAIKSRVSNRNFFETAKLDPKLINSLGVSGFSGVKSSIIENRAEIEWLATQTEIAIKAIMSSRKYRRELSQWVRNNFTGKYDGMPGFTHGVAGFPSLFAKIAINASAKLGPPAGHSADLIRNSSALIIVGYSDEELANYIDVGREYSRVSLLAQRHSVSSSALGAAVIDPTSRKDVVAHFGLDYRPVVILRVGRTKINAPHTPRWSLASLTQSY